MWQDKEYAESILREKTYISNTINSFNNYTESINYYKDLLPLSLNDSEILSEIEEKELKKLKLSLEVFNLDLIFKEPDDHLDCFLEINTGVGGVDACDFSNTLLNMYLKWAKDNNFRVEIINLQEDSVAGITNAIIKISGVNAFGKLKYESGIHRLVRISPFNANGKRQTSFSSVYTYPVIDNTIKIDINEKDLKIDTYRSSGAGGQHVNKTESAVRITHLPTKIVVQCQIQRSQHQNKETALAMLKAKLYALEKQKQQETRDIQNSSKTVNGWGHQIRSYVLNPYQLVKDLRSNYEIADVEGMFNGKYLNDFITSLFNIS